MTELRTIKKLIGEYDEYEKMFDQALISKSKVNLLVAQEGMRETHQKIMKLREQIDIELKKSIDFINEHRRVFINYPEHLLTDEEKDYVTKARLHYLYYKNCKPIIHNPLKIYSVMSMYHYYYEE